MYFHMEICQGQDYEVTFTATDPATGQPMNLTSGYSLVGAVAKKYFGSNPPLYTWHTLDDTVDLLDGSVKIRVPGSDSKDWTWRRVFYDIKVLNNVTEQEIVVAYGPLTLTPTLS